MKTLPQVNILVSFIISTHNRREVLLTTLSQVARCGLANDTFEIFVIDNASTDGTPEAVGERFPRVTLFRQDKNRGSCAKNIALPHSRGRFIVFLDDDSYPVTGSIARMIQHFERDSQLGAAVFTIELPDGSQECSAYPDVFIGCGTGFRRRALEQVGGLPEDFFMQAEEYDLSLRLLDGEWTVKRFDDLLVQHLKTPQARRSGRVMRLDVRNNILLAHRYFPEGWADSFAGDWMRRYYKMAVSKRQRLAFFAGAVQGVVATSLPGNRRPITDTAFEAFAKIRAIEDRLRIAKRLFDLKSVAFIDLGKNILPFWMAARKLGIEVIVIADEKLCNVGPGRLGRYRKIPIVSDDEARSHTFDAAIIANISPVHAAQRTATWRTAERFRPVIDLFECGSVLDQEAKSALIGAGRAGSEFHRIAARSA